MMSDLEKRQRLRDIEERLLTLQRNRALLDDHKAFPDATYSKAELDLEIQVLRQERQLLQEPGALLIWDRVNDMWKIILEMQLDDLHFRRRMVWWMGGLSIGMLLVLLTLAVFSSQMWQITELWR